MAQRSTMAGASVARIAQQLLRTGLRVGKIVALAATVVYAYHVVVVYRRLVQRRALFRSYKGRATAPPTLTHHTVVHAEYSALMDTLVAKVPEPRLGLMSLAKPSVHKIMPEVAGFLAGPAAALLQLAHPYVGHGILQHSAVKSDIKMRFHRTFYFVFRIGWHAPLGPGPTAFGDLDTAVKASRAVRGIHSRIHGTITDGTQTFPKGAQYTAHDKDALFWVLATLFEGALFARELMLGDLTTQERDEVVQFMAENAPVYGIDPRDVPKDYASFLEYYMGMVHSDVLHVSDEGRALGNYLTQPVLWERHVPSPEHVNSVRTLAAVLLPEPIALQFQFPVGTAQYLHAAALLGLIRMFYGLVPEESRQYTMYLKTRADYQGQPLGLLPRLSASLADSFVNLSLGSKPPAVDASASHAPTAVKAEGPAGVSG